MPTPRKKKTEESEDTKVTTTCSVYYEKSLTKNLGNYESAKITVGVTLPVDNPDAYISKIESTIEIADDIVTKELEVQLKEITS